MAWHKLHNFDSISTFWTQRASPRMSWTWKCLLRLRHLAQRFLKCRVGNGKTASFWNDNWTPLGRLIRFLGESGPRNLCTPLHYNVSQACNDSRWLLPSPRSEEAVQLHVFLTTLSLPLQTSEEDSYDWYIGDVKCIGFSASKTWQILRPRSYVKSWTKCIWFKGATPINAFTTWIATLDRLPTRARLSSWGLQVSPLCCL